MTGTAAGTGPCRTGPDGGRRPFVLLGDPVAHSLSPALHHAAFRELGVAAVYRRVRASGAEAPPLMRAAARAGGGGNVTIPAKGAAAAALDEASPAVAATGACNCFWEEDGRLVGDNTDVEGFRRAVAGLLPDGTGEGALHGSRVLLLGAGGGARAVLRACLDGDAGRVDVLNRTVARARAVAREVGGGDDRVRVLEHREERASRYDLVVNATSLGLDPDDPLPLELAGLEVGGAFDLVYGPGGTAWTRHARRLGIPARDGLEMLVRQAAASLRRWLGVDAPVEAMRRAAEAAARREASAGRDTPVRG